jgi:predicted ATPase
MIKHVHITNFKSLEDVAVALDPVTVLIGRSGSGKTNFVEALRWLRDYLTFRNDRQIQERLGSWDRVMSATARRPMTISFRLTFDAPGLTEDFHYELHFQQLQEQSPPQFMEEKLGLGSRVLFHQRQGKWLQPPPLVNSPPAGPLMLGALTGIQEVMIAHLVLTSGIGCYAFPDRVLSAPNHNTGLAETSFVDNGDNFLQAFVGISVNLSTWHHLRDMAASLRRLKPSLKSIDLQQPDRQQIVVSHEAGGKLLVFDLGQESEGFRRLLACLIALYQSPPKQTLIFDEPEKGIYPAGLTILADEFKGYASKGRGQVLLTTHSPEFLDRFAPEQIRVVEMRGHATHVGPVAPEQLEALREHFMKPGDLLTVDEARLAGSLVEAG